jgi:hypothetical protein
MEMFSLAMPAGALMAMLSSPVRMKLRVTVMLREAMGSMPSVLRAMAGVSMRTPQHVGATDELHQVWAQEVANAEDAFFLRHAGFGQGAQEVGIAAPLFALVPALDELCFSLAQMRRHFAQGLRIQRVDVHLGLAAVQHVLGGDAVFQALPAFPGPPAVRPVGELEAGLAVQDAGPVFAGQGDVCLPIGVDHGGIVEQVIALPAYQGQLAVPAAVEIAVPGVVDRVLAEVDMSASLQVHVHVGQQHDGSGAIPVTSGYHHPPTSGGIAGGDGRLDGGIAILGARRGTIDGGVLGEGHPGSGGHHLAGGRTKGGDGEIFLAKREWPGKAINDGLGLLPWIGVGNGLSRLRNACQRQAGRRSQFDEIATWPVWRCGGVALGVHVLSSRRASNGCGMVRVGSSQPGLGGAGAGEGGPFSAVSA